ncbi:MAG: AMP-binding protein [Rhodopseudomonas palustris]|nr:AMP-binding protein [Rhodopseudomonas palustris]
MERIWLKHYPPEVPADIDTTQYPSLVDLFEESFRKFRDRKAFICMDKAITYGELDELSAAFGAYLQSKGLPKGARVAVMMPNVLQYPVATTGGAARRLHGRERQSALHPARTRASAQGLRRGGDRRSSRTSRTRSQQVRRQDAGQAR